MSSLAPNFPLRFASETSLLKETHDQLLRDIVSSSITINGVHMEGAVSPTSPFTPSVGAARPSDG